MARSRDQQRRAYTLDFPDYAQEFLRRNPEYRRQYSELQSMGSGTRLSAWRRMAKPWGLEFPVRALMPPCA